MLLQIELKHQTATRRIFPKCSLLFLLSHQFALSKAGNADRTNQRKILRKKSTGKQDFAGKKLSPVQIEREYKT